MPATLDKDDCEKLIELVRINEVIYDASHEDYKDAQLVQHVWTNIASAMGKNDLDAADCKKKWKNLRDTYQKLRKTRKTSKSGQATKRRNKWRWSDAMKFLDPFLGASRTDSNASAPPGPQADSPQSSDMEAAVDGMDNCTGSSAALASTTASSTPVGPPKKTLKLTSAKRTTKRHDTEMGRAVTQLIDDRRKGRVVTDRLGQCSNETKGGAEEAFFESCAFRMKRLPLQTRSFLQLQISQLFVNAENPGLPPVPITPLPSLQPSAHTTTPQTDNAYHHSTH